MDTERSGRQPRGDEGALRWDPDVYAREARFVADLGVPVVDLLAVEPGERVLDVGCGDGALTEELVRRGADVLGVDASPDMVEAARRRGLRVERGDARGLRFEAEFDAAFSNATLHWVQPPEAVVSGVARALRSGGRFVGEFGGHTNVAALVAALRAVLIAHGADPDPSPWYYPTPAEYAAVLERAGFEVVMAELIPRPTPLPGDLHGWLANFGDAYLGRVEASQRAACRDEVVELLRPALCDGEGRWTVDYVRLRFAARLRSAAPGD